MTKKPKISSDEYNELLNSIPGVIFSVEVDIKDYSIKTRYLNEQAKTFFNRFIDLKRMTKNFKIQDLLVDESQRFMMEKELEKIIKGENQFIKNREFLLKDLNNKQLIVQSSYSGKLENDKIIVNGFLTEKSTISAQEVPKSKLDYYKTVEEEAENLKEFFQTFDALIMILNENGQIQFISPNVGDNILYRPREEVIGRNLREIFPKGQAEFFLSHHNEVLKRGEYYDFEYHLPISNQMRWYQCRLIPVLVKDGKYQQVVAIIRDITEWRIEPI